MRVGNQLATIYSSVVGALGAQARKEPWVWSAALASSPQNIKKFLAIMLMVDHTFSFLVQLMTCGFCIPGLDTSVSSLLYVHKTTKDCLAPRLISYPDLQRFGLCNKKWERPGNDTMSRHLSLAKRLWTFFVVLKLQWLPKCFGPRKFINAKPCSNESLQYHTTPFCTMWRAKGD